MEKIIKIKQHFEEEAKEFDEIIVKLIPYYYQMVNALVSAIPFHKEEPIKAIDLGAGTGTVTKSIKVAFPNAEITCLDISEKMIGMAESKLGEYDKIHYAVGDFYNYEFEEQYDVIVSSLALHHLVTDEDKKLFYSKIYDSLKGGGVFCNADVVMGSNEYLQSVYMEKWIGFMRRNVSVDEIENKWIPKYYEEDSPSKMMKHIEWLEEIGFKGVDVVWKYYNFTVYGGYK